MDLLFRGGTRIFNKGMKEMGRHRKGKMRKGKFLEMIGKKAEERNGERKE